MHLERHQYCSSSPLFIPRTTLEQLIESANVQVDLVRRTYCEWMVQSWSPLDGVFEALLFVVN